MRNIATIVLALFVLMTSRTDAQTDNMQGRNEVELDPPFSGTIFIDPDIITETDPTTFQSMSYAGQGSRTMYDRRVNDWITVNAYLFDASFDDGLSIEIQVNPEFGSSDAAMVQAEKYAPVIGQLPTVLRTDVETVWIHKGVEPFGGGNYNLLIHIGQGDLYINDGILEETFVHEAAHTSLDAYHASAPGWLAAQTADPDFISTYARDYPNREDIAESFLPYLAIRYRSDRISQQLYNTIVQTIPNRIDYFDNQSLDMYPIIITGIDIERMGNAVPEEFVLLQNYPNPFSAKGGSASGGNPDTIIEYKISLGSKQDQKTSIQNQVSSIQNQVSSIQNQVSVSLVVYDILGKEIATLVNETQSPGNYKVTWDASDLPSGIYIYRLQADRYSQTRKMLLLR